MKNQNFTKYLKLPFSFDVKKMQLDLQNLTKTEWLPHFNTMGYEGEWNVIPLYAVGGDSRNIFAISAEGGKIEATDLLKSCDYLPQVIKTFECPIITARLLRLGVGAEIKPHRDHELGYEDGVFRLHIPIQTNNDIEFILAGEKISMAEGECWYTNVNYEHSVVNKGIIDRVHLVIDGERNKWTDELFFSLTSEESLLSKQQNVMSQETLKRTIEELEITGDPSHHHLITNLRSQLQDHSDNN